MQFRRRADPDDDLVEGEASVRARSAREDDQAREQSQQEPSGAAAGSKARREGDLEPDASGQPSAPAATASAGFGSRTGERVKSIVLEAEHAAASIRADAQAEAAALLAAAEEDAKRIREGAQADASDLEADEVTDAQEAAGNVEETEALVADDDGMASAIKEVELAASLLEGSLRRLLTLLNSDLLKQR